MSDHAAPPKPASALVGSKVLVFEADGSHSTRMYEYWREERASQVSAMYGIRRPEGLFRANSVILHLPATELLQFDYSGMSYERDPKRIRADGIDRVAVQLVHRGGLQGRLGERDVWVGPGSAVLVDASRPSLHTSVETQGRAFYMPRQAFGDDPGGLHGQVVAGAAFRRLDAYFSWLTEALPHARSSAAERVQTAIGSVLTATFDPRAEADLQASDALDGLVMKKLRAFIALHAADPNLDTDAVWQGLGSSRATLYRVASPYGGVMALIWSVRLDAAVSALNRPGRSGSISEIAADHGFSTAQHFARRFRDRFGFSPSDLRPVAG